MQTEKEVPRGSETNVVMGLNAIPVVDIEAVLIEVAEIDMIAVRIHIFVYFHLGH